MNVYCKKLFYSFIVHFTAEMNSHVYYLYVHTHKYTQVSVLTDQVEAQGLKISDLESSLVEHQHKLNSTEEMLQQVHSFTDLTSYWLKTKYLKLKLSKHFMSYQDTSRAFI